jgi:hypothetical protein
MAINVTISKGYAWRSIIIGTVCVVLGAWGIYDYAVDIPRRQQLHNQAALLEVSRDALQTEQEAGQPTPEAQEALDTIKAEMERIINLELARIMEPGQETPTQAQMAEAQQNLGPQNEESENARWMWLLGNIAAALMTERCLPLNEQDYPQAHGAFEATESTLAEIGQVTAPGKYDRITQWAFILCLPCAPFFFWGYFSARRRRYTLDDDGTLHSPAGTWAADEITAIDMSRWMAKSIAWPVHKDGGRVKLDDYKYKGLHQIVGAIASRFHPDEWDGDAKPVQQAETPPEPAENAPAPGEEAGSLAETTTEANTP